MGNEPFPHPAPQARSPVSGGHSYLPTHPSAGDSQYQYSWPIHSPAKAPASQSQLKALVTLGKGGCGEGGAEWILCCLSPAGESTGDNELWVQACRKAPSWSLACPQKGLSFFIWRRENIRLTVLTVHRTMPAWVPQTTSWGTKPGAQEELHGNWAL